MNWEKKLQQETMCNRKQCVDFSNKCKKSSWISAGLFSVYSAPCVQPNYTEIPKYTQLRVLTVYPTAPLGVMPKAIRLDSSSAAAVCITEWSDALLFVLSSACWT